MYCNEVNFNSIQYRSPDLLNNFNSTLKLHETKLILANTALGFTLGNTDKLSDKLFSNYKSAEFCTMCF